MKITQASSCASGSRRSRAGRAEAAPGHFQAVADHSPHAAFGEDGVGPFVRVVGVHRNVGGACEQARHDRHVQVGGAGRDPHPDLVTLADAQLGEFVGEFVRGLGELQVAEHGRPVVQGLGVGVGGDGVAEDVHESARRGRRSTAQQAHGNSSSSPWNCIIRRAGVRSVAPGRGASGAFGAMSRCGSVSSL